MSEEEKKAIEHLKNYPINWELTHEVNQMAINVILNLIEKQENKIANQEKEIKLMKSVNINDNYVSKDRIREKIKELDELQKKSNLTGLITEYQIKIQVLEELLGE